jgi:H+/Cl- antiporter ClcA
MVYLIAPINEWAEAASAKQTTDLGAIIINLALLGFICVLIGILTWWIKLSGKLWIQYNEQEMEWQLELQKASKAKWDKWPKYLRWLSKFNG